MSVPRFFCPLELGTDAMGSEIALPDAVAHHALRVLRLAVGADLTLFTGAGGEFAATLTRAGKRDAHVRLDRYSAIEREAPIAITLVQGVAANDAMDATIRHAIELGVAAIAPVVTSRSARVPAGERAEKRHAHWQQIAIAACEQCGRNRVPPILPALPFSSWLSQRNRAATGFLLTVDEAKSFAQQARPRGSIDLLIGPEGGFASEEIAVSCSAGLTMVGLGARVLRTETAALAALAVINLLWGDFA
ncbi:MAG: 16S rRNA (uracil(1498)-N(3))-methyltransferase [Betaproteobacteria bacterium]|nr:16S rRNA (uracil(1498)-N(3))-methyltransferase [Betaproteobacteria bacterium]MBA3777202.1 16S rRNA (uracil(1498)-N(3))-methyltransferase [Betaproteobacteria bacterium]